MLWDIYQFSRNVVHILDTDFKRKERQIFLKILEKQSNVLFSNFSYPLRYFSVDCTKVLYNPCNNISGTTNSCNIFSEFFMNCVVIQFASDTFSFAFA